MARPPTPFEVARALAEGRMLAEAYENGLASPQYVEAYSDDLEEVFDAVVDDSARGLISPLHESEVFHRACDAVYRKLLTLQEVDDGTA